MDEGQPGRKPRPLRHANTVPVRGGRHGHYHDDGTLCLSSDHEDADLYDSGAATDEDADPDEPKPMSLTAVARLVRQASAFKDLAKRI